jgi:hypothetical protein
MLLLFHNNSFNAPRLNGNNKNVQEKEGQKKWAKVISLNPDKEHQIMVYM